MMDDLGIYKLPLLLLVGLSTTLAASQTETRWLHVCRDTPENLTCPERHIFRITDAVLAYKADYCPSNLTDPVENVADCNEPFRGKESLISDTRSRCNGSRSCGINFDGAVFVTCTTADTGTANFLAVSYKCYADPNPPTTTQATMTPNSTVTATSQPSTVASEIEPFPYIIPIAVAVGATVLLILIICLIICCIWRNRGDTSIDRPDVRKESVTEVNIKRGEDIRVKTAPRFKEEPGRNRPDLNSKTFDENGQVQALSDPRGLYALPDKSHKAPVTIEIEEPQPPSHHDTIAPEKETSPQKPLIKHNYEKTKVDNGSSTYTNVVFAPDDVTDDEVSHYSNDVKHPHVRFASDDEDSDRGSPDGGHSEPVTLREGDLPDRDKVTSAMYAKVNKQGKQVDEDPLKQA